jgi:hypothetical protein
VLSRRRRPGAAHKKCAAACAKAGNPIGLVTEKGDVYVMMGLKDHQPGKDVLINKMAPRKERPIK